MRNTLVIAAALVSSLTAFAQDPTPVKLKAGEHTQLDVAGLQRLSIANPNVADVRVAGATTFEIDAKCPGKTTLLAWGDHRYTFTVEVSGTAAKPAQCDAPAPTTRIPESRTVELEVGQSRTVSVPHVTGFTVDDSKIADAHPSGDDGIALVGKAAGRTSILILRDGKPVEAWAVQVH